MLNKRNTGQVLAVLFSLVTSALAQSAEPFSAMDVFEIVYIKDPVVSPDGQHIAFNRGYMDVMTDRRRSALWVIDSDGQRLREVSKTGELIGSAAFSPSSDAIAFALMEKVEEQGEVKDVPRLHLLGLSAEASVELGSGLLGPANLAFSPDGKWLAFTDPVAYEPEPMGNMPAKPSGAKWAEPFIVETRDQYAADGAGFLPYITNQVFLVSTAGGPVRQVTEGHWDYASPLTWLPDSSGLLTSINLKNEVNKPLDTDVVRLDIDTGQITPLTSQLGPDVSPKVSPDGTRIAWMGYEEKHLSYQNQKLYTAELDGSNVKGWTHGHDFSVFNFAWHPDGERIYIQYEEHGRNVLALLDEKGSINKLSDELAGWELDQPYTTGQFSANAGVVAFGRGDSTTLTELAVSDDMGRVKTITGFNKSLHESALFSAAEERWVESSFDQRNIQFWINYPPNFDPTQTYPLLLQIHGGPHAGYGPQFAANNQLYAAAGYVVVYSNPRGSTGYGEEFALTINHNFPSRDYDDLMDVVDATVSLGFIDEERLYVTGGSGGGVLTSWIVGKTDRFRAAVAVNPVINWISGGLTMDLNKLFVNYYYSHHPWNDPTDAWTRSPLSLVGKVTTPTMLMTGENDLRTPISEAEQYFNALKMEGVDTALVRVPGASHFIESRPSHLIAKVNAIIAWFERYAGPTD